MASAEVLRSTVVHYVKYSSSLHEVQYFAIPLPCFPGASGLTYQHTCASKGALLCPPGGKPVPPGRHACVRRRDTGGRDAENGRELFPQAGRFWIYSLIFNSQPFINPITLSTSTSVRSWYIGRQITLSAIRVATGRFSGRADSRPR